MREPGGGVPVRVVETDPASQEEPPLWLLQLVDVLQEVDTQEEGEQELLCECERDKQKSGIKQRSGKRRLLKLNSFK